MGEAAPHLSVDLEHRLGSLALDVHLQTAAPWTVLFGPSGSGKSTVLRAVAGLLRPDSARIVAGLAEASPSGQEARPGPAVFVDTAAGIFVPAHRRPVRWSGQVPALFPHRTVASNLAAGLALHPGASLRSHPAPLPAQSQSRTPLSNDGPEQVHAALVHFGLERLAGTLPAALSGGQRQRVAVVRAAVGARGKLLLLLDEPFAGLDADTRDRLIADLRSWLGDTPVVSVTHDIGEAFLLGAEVVRLGEGRVVAQGPVAAVLGAERERLKRILG